MKKLKIAGLGLAILLIGMGVSVVAVNAYDPKLEPEVTQVLAAQPEFSEKQQRAYFFVLGLHAGELENPEKKGQELWQKFNSLSGPDQRQFWRQEVTKVNAWPTSFEGCETPRRFCSVTYVNEHPEVIKRLQEDPEALRNYIKLMEYGTVANIFRGNSEIAFPKIWIISPKMHQKFILQLAVWLKNGGRERVLNELELSNSYLQSILNGGSLFERMAAGALLGTNADFLSEEIQRDKKLKLTSLLVESFHTAGVVSILRGALDNEVRSMANLVASVETHQSLESVGMTNVRFKPMVKKILPIRQIFRPHETINKYYNINMDALNSGCIPEKDVRCAQAGWLNPIWPWSYIENPVGRGLVRIMNMDVPLRRKRLEAGLHKIDRARREFLNYL